MASNRMSTLGNGNSSSRYALFKSQNIAIDLSIFLLREPGLVLMGLMKQTSKSF